MHVLYRFFNAKGVLLYIGRTAVIGKRFGAHRREKEWWPEITRIELEHFPDGPTLAVAERAAIETEKALHNVIHGRPRTPREVNGRTYSERHARRLRRGR